AAVPRPIRATTSAVWWRICASCMASFSPRGSAGASYHSAVLSRIRQLLEDQALRPLLLTSTLCLVLLLTAWLAGRTRVTRLDARLSGAIRFRPLPFADVATTVTRWLFSVQVLIPAVAAAALVLWLTGRRPLSASLTRFFAAVAVGFVLKAALRLPAPETLIVNARTARIGCNALE